MIYLFLPCMSLCIVGCADITTDMFSSPGYPSEYPNNVDACWLISAPYTQTVRDAPTIMSYLYIMGMLLNKVIFLSMCNSTNKCNLHVFVWQVG